MPLNRFRQSMLPPSSRRPAWSQSGVADQWVSAQLTGDPMRSRRPDTPISQERRQPFHIFLRYEGLTTSPTKSSR
jgi:hypothetical protein